jgi:drug/metabolite transporter (DMT)-like permease
MLVAVVLFVVMDALGKYLSLRYPVIQVVWARYAFHLLAMAPILLHPRVTVLTNRLGLQLLRSMCLLGTTFLFYSAVQHIPLATANAIAFVGPLLVTALSVPLLGERVGPRRWAAVFVGFIGVMVIIRPGAGMRDWAMLLPVGVAVCFAFYQITTRLLSRTDAALTTLFWTGAGGLLVSTAALPFNWTTPDLFSWVLLASIGVVGCVSHLLMIKAYQAAPAAVLAPFIYTQLVWAIPMGYVLFGDFPDSWTLVGAAIVVGSGLYVWYRESARRRKD